MTPDGGLLLERDTWTITHGFDLHNLRKLPIVPGEQLGGFRIGANISEYREILVAEHDHRSYKMPKDDVRQREQPWGDYVAAWAIEITLWPVRVHVDIREGSIFRVEGQPGYESDYNGVKVGMRVIQARESRAALA